MTQHYGGLPPYERSSATSKAAALSIAAVRGGQARRVYTYVLFQGAYGATSDEVERGLGGLHQAISARLRDLVQDGKIVDAGFTRPTRSGTAATVYIAVVEVVHGELQLGLL